MPSHKVLDWRDKISALWHHNASVWEPQENYGFKSSDTYFAFCAAKDWLQDTSEALLIHREKGFSEDSHLAYIEFWGVLQAVFIQQDAISELHYALTGNRDFLQRDQSAAWSRVRKLRNLAVGHPTNRRGGKEAESRCVSGREVKSYERIRLQVFKGTQIQHQILDLGSMLDRYDEDAAKILESLYSQLKTQLDRETT